MLYFSGEITKMFMHIQLISNLGPSTKYQRGYLQLSLKMGKKNICGSDFFIDAFKICSEHPMLVLLLITVNSSPWQTSENTHSICPEYKTTLIYALKVELQ